MENSEKTTFKLIREKVIHKDGLVYKYCISVSDDAECSPLYSITADLHDESGNKISKSDAGIKFSDFKNALSLFDFLSENLASPKHLRDIVEDLFTFV